MSNETPTSLYRHFGADGSLLYVGISLSWPARTRAHSRHSVWFAQVAKVEIEQFSSRQEALNAEREAIGRERPRFNVIHNSRKPKRRPEPPRSNLTPVSDDALSLLSAKERRRYRDQLLRQQQQDPLLRKITGPHAIVGPALVYKGSTVSVLVAHGEFGTEGELTELVLGELFPDLPQWTDACDTVLTIRRPDELTIEEARSRRLGIVKILTANLDVVQSFDTDLTLATAYATQFPSSKSRQVLDQVISEQHP